MKVIAVSYRQVPLAPEVDFNELGRRFEFNSGAISGATVRAAAKVALRPLDKRLVTLQDLVEAAEAEKDARRDEIDEIAMRAFI
jgi:ATP-dependent 26S proteasome regulatory subunit